MWYIESIQSTEIVINFSIKMKCTCTTKEATKNVFLIANHWLDGLMYSSWWCRKAGGRSTYDPQKIEVIKLRAPNWYILYKHHSRFIIVRQKMWGDPRVPTKNVEVKASDGGWITSSSWCHQPPSQYRCLWPLKKIRFLLFFRRCLIYDRFLFQSRVSWH